MKRILMDCDPGIDDAVAMILALHCGALQVEAITTVTGNLTADRTCANALKVLDLMDAPDITVAAGMLTPLVRKFPRDPFSHGDDGLGNTGLPLSARRPDPRFAPDVIVETVNRYPNDITLVATGPLTNIALALMKDPSLAQKVNELIIIGGAFGFNKFASTNATGDNPVSEWNIYVDPEAARHVFHSGIGLTAVGLDVATHERMCLRPQDYPRLQSSPRREARFLLDLIKFVEDRGFLQYCVLIDSLAVAAAMNPSILQTLAVHCDVETQGELTRGQTVADIRNNFRWAHLPLIRAACDADFDAFLDLVVGVLAGDI
jgi:purine nucleosidase/pyrimidine-specific ribonucleoside hydrolase